MDIFFLFFILDIVLCRAAARNKQYLSQLGVTHVLNTAEQGVGSFSHGTVNLDKVEMENYTSIHLKRITY